MGTAGRLGATNAQCWFQPAPCSIQSLILSFCASLRVLCVEGGGIRLAGFSSVIFL